MLLFHVHLYTKQGIFLHFGEHLVWKFLAGPPLLAGPSYFCPPQGPNPLPATQPTRTQNPPSHFPRDMQLGQPAAGQIAQRSPWLLNVLEQTKSC